MRVLFAHCHYKQHGGEDRVVEAEIAALRTAGHEAVLLERDNRSIRSTWDAARTAWELPGTEKLRAGLREEIADAAPDIVHAHNIFPLITPSLYDAAGDLGIPVVQTLHNYRNICASALLMRDGRICEDCVGASPYRAVLHRCYRNSVPGSLALARMIDLHRRRGTWKHAVGRFIALTEFSRGRFVAGGLPADRISVIGNSPGPAFAAAPDDGPREGALFVGRLSEEKGIAALLDIWRTDWPPLRVIGDGPDRPALDRAAAEGRAVALGTLGASEIAAEMHRAALCVLPSRCYENFPMTLAEAFAAGLPVAASRIGALGELVEDGKTGCSFDPFDAADTERVIGRALSDPARLRRWGKAARQHYEESLSSDRNTAAKLALYEELISARAAA
ncbi:glycosyltransferase [Nisaea acidiphila]|uniref:Glycosyltransferase n=1 Tax=Nisaea acidiphila TaxID=1862145 RepID=A0A9J7B058_9PROT|nr:glycosyltransferase [Nisaea acidiphila]UUX52049.1 glycosyltransferase [Nisaea acidiphila]